jgi:hypothetical protein
MIRRLLVMAAFAVASAAPSASAALISGTLVGEITSSGGGVPGVEVGDAVVGSYTFDDSIVQSGNFQQINPLTAFSLVIGNNPRVFTLADLMTGNSMSGRRIDGSTPGADQIVFFFDSDILTDFIGGNLIQQSVSFLLPAVFEVQAVDPALSFEFTLSGVRTAAVPEPSALALLGLGGLGLVGLARHAGRRAVA